MANKDDALKVGFERELGRVSGNVLNLGCGEGWESQVIKKHVKNLTSGDISEFRLSMFKERKGINVLKLDWDNLPFEDNTFDAVILFNSIHHSHNTVKTLNEIYRVLKPDGLFLAVKEPICPFVFSPFWKKRLQQEHGDSHDEDKENNWTFYEWRDFFRRSKFVDVEIRPSEITVERVLEKRLDIMNIDYSGKKYNWDEKLMRPLEVIKVFPFRIINIISNKLAKKAIHIAQLNFFALSGVTLVSRKQREK